MKKITLFLVAFLTVGTAFSQITVEKLWEFSAATTPTSTKPSWLAADDGRSMVMRDGKLYIMMRTTTSVKIIDTKAADITAAVTTPTSLTLSGYLTGSNCLSFTDDGQLLGGSYAGATLKVSKINLTTGVTTQLLENLPEAGIGRFDYFSSYGDFSSTGTGYIISSTCPSAGAGGFNIYKWDFTNGTIADQTVSTKTVRSAVFGSSSMIVPVDANSYFVMSASTNPELFTMSGTNTQFANVFVSQGAAAASGMTTFELNGKKYFIRTEGRFGGMSFYDINSGVASAVKLTASTPVLGATANTTVKTSIVTEKISANLVNIYILAPNNGIAAYKIYDFGTGIANPTSDNRIKQTSTGIEVILDSKSLVEIYDIKGILIDKNTVTGSYSHYLNNGVYIIRINGKATKFIK